MKSLSSLDPARLKCLTGFLTILWKGEQVFELSKATERTLQNYLLSKQSNDSKATYGHMAFTPTKRARVPRRTGQNCWMRQKALNFCSRDRLVGSVRQKIWWSLVRLRVATHRTFVRAFLLANVHKKKLAVQKKVKRKFLSECLHIKPKIFMETLSRSASKPKEMGNLIQQPTKNCTVCIGNVTKQSR